MKQKETKFKDSDFYKVLELSMLYKHSPDEELISLIMNEINVTKDVAEKYLESLYDFYSSGVI